MKKLPLLLVAFLSLVLTTSCENEPLDPNIVGETPNPNPNPGTQFYGTLNYDGGVYDMPQIQVIKQTVNEETVLSYGISGIQESGSNAETVQVLMMINNDDEFDVQTYTLQDYFNYVGSVMTVTLNSDGSTNTTQQVIFNAIDDQLESSTFEIKTLTESNIEIDFSYTTQQDLTVFGSYDGPYNYTEQTQ